MRREGLSSLFVRDSWIVMNAQEQQIAAVKEDSSFFGLLRRHVDFVALFFPQKFVVSIGEQQVGEMQQNKNPFTVRYDVSSADGAAQALGTILLLAIPNLITIIEGRQS